MRQIDNVRNDNIVVERNTNKELNIINISNRVIDKLKEIGVLKEY